MNFRCDNKYTQKTESQNSLDLRIIKILILVKPGFRNTDLG